MPSQQILNLIDKDEKILYIGTYDIRLRSTYQFNLLTTDPNAYSATGFIDFKFDNKKLVNTHSNINNTGSTGTIISVNQEPVFISESYTMNTLSHDNAKSLGQIMWSSNYITTNISTITPQIVQTFMVNGNIGMYKKVCKVIIDFTQPIRVVYFITPLHI